MFLPVCRYFAEYILKPKPGASFVSVSAGRGIFLSKRNCREKMKSLLAIARPPRIG
jgi:hypothetical protein